MCEINWEYVIALSSIFASIIISIASIVHSRNSAIKERINNTISSKRIDWMQELKELYSNYSKHTSFSAIKNFAEDDTKFIEDLSRITSYIKVHLNLNGTLDNEIVNLINKINVSYEKLLTLRKFQKRDETYINKDLLWHLQRFHPEMFEDVFSELAEKIKSETKDSISAFEIINKFTKDDNFIKDHITKLGQAIQDDMKKSIKIIEHGDKLLQLLFQVYLKAEWERVKYEAKTGKYENYNFDKKVQELKSQISTETEKLEKVL